MLCQLTALDDGNSVECGVGSSFGRRPAVLDAAAARAAAHAQRARPTGLVNGRASAPLKGTDKRCRTPRGQTA
jgi:hypothetical protein